MGNMMSGNDFPVAGRTVLITGGSKGMGLEAGRQLAEKGANVVIVARGATKLKEGVEYIEAGAVDKTNQKFHWISADLTSPVESKRIIDEVTAWNSGNPPDIVWCCAGSSIPTLFVDTPIEDFKSQMDSNYFTSLYMAHAAVKRWVKNPQNNNEGKPASHGRGPLPARHLIFTASFLALYGFAGYTPYTPTKAAIRALSDSLSQEMNLYAGAHPDQPRVRVHTVFPATILTEAYDAENLIKTDITKLLEEGDDGQTPALVASRSIKALESGQELITTDLLTGLVKRGALGGSIRGGFWSGLLDWILGGIMALVMIFVRADMDRKVKSWGGKYGPSGMKSDDKRA